MSSITNPVNFCQPLHHTFEGPTDPSLVTLPPNFSVLVVGGSRAIGLGIAKAYALAGASSIIISARSHDQLAEAAQTISSLNPKTRVLTCVCDITSEEDIRGLLEFTERSIGEKLNVLVINAGTSTQLVTSPTTGLRVWPQGLTQSPTAEFLRVMNTNLTASYLLLYYFLPMLEEGEGGDMIQIGSAAASYTKKEIGMPVSYSLSKMAVTRLVEHVAEGHVEKVHGEGRGVRAFTVQPGGVKGTGLGEMPEGRDWDKVLIDDPMLAGGFCVWLTKEKRSWLSGRYLDSRWDMLELEKKKEEIIKNDLLKFRLAM